jgi:hypothetical protein
MRKYIDLLYNPIIQALLNSVIREKIHQTDSAVPSLLFKKG